MASYVSPVDLIAPYLQPLIGSVNTGIEQGIKLGTLQQAINKEKMLEPYYGAHTALYNAQAKEKELQEKRFNEALGRLGGSSGGMSIPEGAVTPQTAFDLSVILGRGWDKMLPKDNLVSDAGVVVRTPVGGQPTAIQVPGLGAKQEFRNLINGESEQAVNYNPRTGSATPVMITRTIPAPEPAVVPADFTFGRGIPEATAGTQPTPAIPGPRFAPKVPAAKPYMDPQGGIILVDTNSPDAQTMIDSGKLVPYSKPAKPEKPEYSPKQALSRISTIDATIARMKSSGTIDISMAIQNPAFAGLVDTKDPEAIKQAITSLTQEREYVSQFLPKPIPQPKEDAPKMKTLDQKTAVEILKEARGDKNKAREIARKRGYAF